MSISRTPISDLILEGKQKRSEPKGSEVWNLNLDQIESGSGRVLKRVFTTVDKLGPSTYAFEAGTVLYSKLRPYLNKVVVTDCNGYATTELVPLRCNPKKVFAQYLAYYLRSAEFLNFANTVVAGAKMPRMVMSEFWRYKVPLPSLPEQHRIAAILDKADALRTKRQEALAQLDKLAHSIFMEMFGDPVTNSKGWSRVCLGEIIKVGPQNGLYKPSSDYGSGIPILRIDGFYDGVVTGIASLKRLRVSEKELATYGLSEDDIVINRVNSPEYLGKSALIPRLEEPIVYESNMMRMSVETEKAAPRYVVEFLQSNFIKSQIRTASKDAVNQSSINQQDVKGFVINLPPLPLQAEFAKRLVAIDKVRLQQRLAINSFDDLFSTLQHRAFLGIL